MSVLLPVPAGHHVGMTAIVRAPFCHGKLGVAGLGSTRLGSRPRRLDLVEHLFRGRVRMPAREPRITDRRSARCRTAGAEPRLSPTCHNQEDYPAVSTVWGRLRPDQDQRINRRPAEMLTMDPPGSSQLMDPVE